MRKGRFVRAMVWMLIGAMSMACLGDRAAYADDKDTEPKKVDPATKQLMRGNVLYQRRLYDLAAAEYETFLKRYGNNQHATTARYALAVCYYRMGQPDKAIENIQQVLKARDFKKPDEALTVMGHCYLQKQDYKQAVEAFDTVRQKYGKSPWAAFASINRVQALYMMGQTKASLAAADEFLKQHGKTGHASAALYFKGLAHRALDQFEEGEKAVAQLLKDYKNSPYEFDAGLLLGQCLAGQGKHEEAVKQLSSLLNQAPKARRPAVHYTLGPALQKTGKFDEAIKHLSTVVNDYKESRYAKPALMQLGITYYTAQRYDDARKVLEQVARHDEDRKLRAQYWLALCDMAGQKYDDAWKRFDGLIKQKDKLPNAQSVFFDRAMCALNMQQYETAAKAFEAFRKEYPKSADADDALYQQAFCLHQLKQYEESHKLCGMVKDVKDEALQRDVKQLDAENLFLLERYKEAEAAFASLLKNATDAQRDRLTLRLGQAAYFQGDFTKALETLKPLAQKDALKKEQPFHDAWFLLGDASLQTGANEPAISYLATYLQISDRQQDEARLKLALAQQRANKTAEAKNTLKPLIEQKDANAWVQRALLEYGEITSREEDAKTARDVLGRLLQSDPPTVMKARATYLLGWLDFNDGEYKEAAAKFAKVTGDYAKAAPAELVADSLFQQGVALKEAKDHDNAIKALAAYLDRQSDGTHARRARHLIAQCQAELGKSGDAVKTLAVLANNKDSVNDKVLYDLAWAYRDEEKPKEAIDTYQRLIKEYSDSQRAAAARTELAQMLYDRKEYKQAATLLSEAIKHDKSGDRTKAVAHYWLGWCLYKQDEKNKAADHFAAFAKAMPQDELAASAHYQAGLSYTAARDYDKAGSHFAAVVKHFGKHELAAPAMIKLGETQAERGRFDDSLRTYQGFLKQWPKHDLVYLAQWGTGWALEQRNRLDDALQWYTKVTDNHDGPTAARAQFQIGEVYIKQDKLDLALRALLAVEGVYDYPQWSSAALYEAGQVFERKKEVKQAKEYYQLCVTKYKDQAVSELAAKRLKALGG